MRKVIAAAALTVWPLSGFAADLPKRSAAPAPAPVLVSTPSWAGPYVGMFGGWAGIRNSTTDISGEEYGGSSEGAKMSLHHSRFFGGATLGYNFQRGAWVFGPEFELGYLIADKTKVINGDDGLLVNYKGLYGFAGARVGYLVTDKALLFAKAGVVGTRIRSAGGEFDGVGDEDDGGYWGFDGTEAAGGAKTRLGFSVGAGVEVSLSNQWSMKIEYNFKQFANTTYQTIASDVQPFRFSDEVHAVKVGLNYRFGAPARPVVARY